MERSALVTGGSGFLGGHLTELLVQRGWRVRVLDLHEPAVDRLEDWIEADVRNGAAVRQAARKVDVVFHLAAIVGVDRLLADPVECIDVTVNGTRNALEAAAAAGAGVVHLSTSEVLGRNPQLPWAEDAERMVGSALVDRWSYGSAKATAEHVVLAGGARLGVPVTVIRPFNVYGPGQQPLFVVARMVEAALDRRPITIHGSGRQTRCFTYVDDVVRGVMLAGEQVGAARVLHLGRNDETSMLGLAGAVAAAVGWELDVVHVDPQARWGEAFEDIDRRVPDASLARRTLGWEPTVDLPSGLERTVAWSRQVRSRLDGQPSA